MSSHTNIKSIQLTTTIHNKTISRKRQRRHHNTILPITRRRTTLIKKQARIINRKPRKSMTTIQQSHHRIQLQITSRTAKTPASRFNNHNLSVTRMSLSHTTHRTTHSIHNVNLRRSRTHINKRQVSNQNSRTPNQGTTNNNLQRRFSQANLRVLRMSILITTITNSRITNVKTRNSRTAVNQSQNITNLTQKNTNHKLPAHIHTNRRRLPNLPILTRSLGTKTTSTRITHRNLMSRMTPNPNSQKNRKVTIRNDTNKVHQRILSRILTRISSSSLLTNSTTKSPINHTTQRHRSPTIIQSHNTNKIIIDLHLKQQQRRPSRRSLNQSQVNANSSHNNSRSLSRTITSSIRKELLNFPFLCTIPTAVLRSPSPPTDYVQYHTPPFKQYTRTTRPHDHLTEPITHSAKHTDTTSVAPNRPRVSAT